MLSYEEPDVAFPMLDQHISTHILHIHGAYDSAHGIDNIIADEAQYKAIETNEGAQFIQNILGTIIRISGGLISLNPLRIRLS